MYGVGYIECHSRWALPWCILRALFNSRGWGLVYIVRTYRPVTDGIREGEA